jgi:hypothetical protein
MSAYVWLVMLFLLPPLPSKYSEVVYPGFFFWGGGGGGFTPGIFFEVGGVQQIQLRIGEGRENGDLGAVAS